EDFRNRALNPLGRQLASLARALTPGGMTRMLQRWLDHAGNPPGWAPERVLEMQGLGLLVGAALAVGAGLTAGASATTLIGLAVGGGRAGWWLPFRILVDIGLRRQQQIRRTLPDAMDLLTVSVEAGLGFDAAVAQVARAMPGPLAGELSRMLQE